jgi:hypothetical protein
VRGEIHRRRDARGAIVVIEHREGRDALGSTGTEFLDWQEVWCFRCEHDRDVDVTGGCELVARLLFHEPGDEPVSEIFAAGYRVHFEDPDTGEPGCHDIPNVFNSLPAAAFCTRWQLAADPARHQHVNGAVITSIELGVKGWQL